LVIGAQQPLLQSACVVHLQACTAPPSPPVAGMQVPCPLLWTSQQGDDCGHWLLLVQPAPQDSSFPFFWQTWVALQQDVPHGCAHIVASLLPPSSVGTVPSMSTLASMSLQPSGVIVQH
jgi:hypothetical protein